MHKTIFIILLSGLLYGQALAEGYKEGKKEEEQKKEIFLEVVTGGELPEAKIASIKEKAKGSSLEVLRLQGEITKENRLDGKKKSIEVLWNKASYKDKVIYLNDPLESKVTVVRELEPNDTVPATGNLENLLAAWQKMADQSEMAIPTQEKKAEDKEKQTPPLSTGSGGGYPLATHMKNPSVPLSPPSFAVADEPVITTERCGFTENIANEEIIIKRKTLKDGKEIIGCTEQATEHMKLFREYSMCTVIPDFQKEQVYLGYKLKWTDPDMGTVQYAKEGECLRDEDKASAFIYTKEGCGLQPDFAKGISYQLQKIQYHEEGVPKLVQDCSVIEGKSEAYMHQSTRNGCPPIIQGKQVTFQSRKYIEIEGHQQAVSECAPEAGGSIAITEEVCDSYEHDFTAGVSYQRVTRYYLDSAGNKTYIPDNTQCTRSDIAFTHYADMNSCAITYTDHLKQSQFHARKFITTSNGPAAPEAERIYITECQAEGQPVPYVKKGTAWQKLSQRPVTLQVDTESVSFTVDRNDANYPWGWSGNNRRICGQFSQCINIPTRTIEDVAYFAISGHWCNERKLPGNWVPKELPSITLDKEKSDGQPLWDIQTGCNDNGPINPHSMTHTYNCYSRCTIPGCEMTSLAEYPLYLRPDGSEYMDESTTLGKTYVCGEGTKLTERESDG